MVVASPLSNQVNVSISTDGNISIPKYFAPVCQALLIIRVGFCFVMSVVGISKMLYWCCESSHVWFTSGVSLFPGGSEQYILQ